MGQQNNVVRVLDGAQAMCHDQHGADVLHLLQRVLNEDLCLRIDVGGGLVQNHDGGLMQDGPGEAQQLPLSGGEVIALLPDSLVQAAVQLFDEAFGVDIPAGLPDVLVRYIIGPQNNVAADVSREQEHILKHLAEMTAQRGNLDVSDVDAVNQDLALLDIVIPANQVQNGGFSGTGRTHKGHGLFGVHMEGNALQNPFAGVVSKPHIFELNFAPDLLQLNGIRLIHHLGNHVQNGEYFLRRGKGLLQHIKLLRQSLNGIKEPGDIHIERDHGFAGNGLAQERRVLDIALAADIEEEQIGGDEQHIHHGPENAEYKHPVHLGFLQALAADQEFVHFPLFLIEDLGNLHAGEVFGQVGVHIRPGVIDRAVDMAGELLEDDGKEHQKRYKAQDHQRQSVVQNQHCRQHTDDHQRVLRQSHQNVGEQIADGVGVIGDSRHQLAHGDLVQLRVGKLLNVGEGIQTDLRQDLLAGLLQNHCLEIGADHGYHQNARIYSHQRIELRKLEVLLDGALNVRHQQG